MTDHSPKVSVIIPTHNRAHLIRRALSSVLNQTYRNLEIIVVDDGSTDATELIVQSFSDNRIRYLRTNVKQGAAAARNLGIKNSSADFIAFQDSDDEWLTEKLEKQMAVFAHSGEDVGVVYSGFIRVKGHCVTYFPADTVKVKSGDILKPLLFGNFVANPSIVARRECLISSGLYDEKLQRFQDWDLCIRMAIRYEFICIDEPLLLAYHSESSITADDSRIYEALKRIIDKHKDVYSKNNKAFARNLYDLGGAACKAGHMTEGLRCFIKAFLLNPLHLMTWVRFVTALFGRSFYLICSEYIAQVYYRIKKYR